MKKDLGTRKRTEDLFIFMRIITDARGQPQFVFLLENIDAVSGVRQEQRKPIYFYSKSLNEIQEQLFALKSMVALNVPVVALWNKNQ